MSNVKTNKFGGALLFILGECAAADAEMIEDGGMEVFGEDDQGREGSCEVSINDLAQAASHEINHLTEHLAKANERVKELEVQLKRLIDYEADQALLPEASSQGTRQLVNDIKNDATDVGGCYEVSCGLLDSLFEHYTDKGASKLLNKFAIEKKIEALENAEIPLRAKVGCIGEFKFTIENANCCPECYHDKTDDCEICEGDTDENGLSDLTATVPWDLCKDIWLRMNKIYAEQLREEQAHG